MSGLGRIQHDFQEYLLRSTAGVVDHVAGTDRVPLPTRLRVYSDAYYSRLTEALASNFPALAELIGEKDFQPPRRRVHRDPRLAFRIHSLLRR